MSSPQTVFVTGGNRGLGLEMVKQLSELSDPPKFIFATYRNADGAKELLEFAKSNKSIRPLQFDVKDTKNYTKIVDEVSFVVGDNGLNLLINNAAVAPPCSFDTITKEDMFEAYEVNTVVPTLLTRAFLPLLKKGFENSNGTAFTWSRAAVINIASMLGSITNAANVAKQDAHAYKISKAGLNMATKLLSLDLKPHNILVAGVHPGWVQTDMGGPDATFKKQDSISNVLFTIKMLTEVNNGGYISFNGEPIPY